MEIPIEVTEDLRQIRDEGTVNMIDLIGVQRAAYEAELFFLVDWLENNRRSYMDALKTL